jgi:hypothetical protein
MDSLMPRQFYSKGESFKYSLERRRCRDVTSAAKPGTTESVASGSRAPSGHLTVQNCELDRDGVVGGLGLLLRLWRMLELAYQLENPSRDKMLSSDPGGSFLDLQDCEKTREYTRTRCAS